ncbi:MAG: hypothetical protein JW902_19365 [Syntrophaceae bacterium]|nr:hypothetical protein [Syntrophaceae bacterium]
MKRTILTGLIFLIVMMSAAITISAEGLVPEVGFCAENRGLDYDFLMIFDLKGGGIICKKAMKTVTLDAPSENADSWISFTHGKLLVGIGKSFSTEYGYYCFMQTKVNGVDRIICGFWRKGKNENPLGSLAGQGGIYDPGEVAKKVGEHTFLDVVTPEGQKRKLHVHRLTVGQGPWIVQYKNGVFRVEGDGKLRQIAWVEWRKISAPDGKPYVILMTKGMGKNDVWAGRYNDILYKDKKKKWHFI